MWRCFFIKRRLVDYLEGDLDVVMTQRVQAHLDECPSCQKIFLGAQKVVQAASETQSPQMGDEFWKRFDAGLNERLDERLQRRFEAQERPFVLLRLLAPRPVFVAVSLAVIVVTLVLRLDYAGGRLGKSRMARQEVSEFVQDMDLLDQVSGGNGIISLAAGDDASEIKILYELDPASIENLG